MSDRRGLSSGGQDVGGRHGQAGFADAFGEKREKGGTPRERGHATPPVAGVAGGGRCCGCGACAVVCPAGCLAMRADDLGFLVPACGQGCVGCGACAQVCPVLSGSDAPRDEARSVWWARASDDVLRARSSSGGVFGLLARDVLAAGGSVWGAAFDEGCASVRHVRAESEAGLERLIGSKYVQSSVGRDVYEGVAADLRAGVRVLFSGTPCQVAAMRGYLAFKRVPRERLLLVDVVCHGAPSPLLWRRWLGFLGDKAARPVDAVDFRSKETGWRSYSVTYASGGRRAAGGEYGRDWYMRAFLNNASLRGSCFCCPAKRRCGGDVALGDFWGVWDCHPEADDDKGVSAVLCDTEAGQAAFDAVRGSLVCGEATFDEVASDNGALVASVTPHPRRERFLSQVTGGVDMAKLVGEWRFEPAAAQRLRSKLSALKRRLKG